MRDAALVAMQVLEIAAVASAADRVAAFQPLRRLDLDDIGAPVGELARAGGPRPHPRQVEHRQMIERGRGARHSACPARLSSCAPKVGSGRAGQSPNRAANSTRGCRKAAFRPGDPAGLQALRMRKVSNSSPRDASSSTSPVWFSRFGISMRGQRIGAFHHDNLARGHALAAPCGCARPAADISARADRSLFALGP